MAMDNGDLEIAREWVKRQRSNTSQSRAEQELHIRYLEKTSDGNTLIQLLENLRGPEFSAKSYGTSVKKSTALVVLGDRLVSRVRKLDFWKGLSRKHRSDPEVLRVYVKFLIDERMYTVAETLLLQYLKRKWEPSLVLMYSRIPVEPAGKQQQQLDDWSKTRNYETELKLAKAYYAARGETAWRASGRDGVADWEA